MVAIDGLVRRALRRIKDALPGHTTASRLLRQSQPWRQLPPNQRGAAFVQFYRTRQELLRIHRELKIAPKIIDFLFRMAITQAGLAIGALVALIAITLLLNP